MNHKLRKTLKLLGFHRLYSAIYNNIFMVARAVSQEMRLFILMLGNRKYTSNDEVMLANLRTNAHIIDKGLQADSWVAGRGSGPYIESIKLLNQLSSSPLISDPSYQWANNIVLEYESAKKSASPKQPAYVPKHNDDNTRNLLYEIIRDRRSTRSFIDRPIEPDVLEKLVSIVNWGPVSCNRQPIVLHVVQKRELIDKTMKLCDGATCFSEINPPYVIIVCTDMRFYKLIDRHVSIIDGTFGVQNLLLVAHTYGIEGTVLNWMHATRRKERILRGLLNIPKYQRVIFNIALGYPSKAAPVPMRKGIDRTYIMH